MNIKALFKLGYGVYAVTSKKDDPDGGIKPGTAFEDIPNDWVCPVCGAAKEQFE